jgi:hypothetical protein
MSSVAGILEEIQLTLIVNGVNLTAKLTYDQSYDLDLSFVIKRCLPSGTSLPDRQSQLINSCIGK